MLATWIQSKKDEEGFTLIELLVVVIIIGILAAIAIPVFLNQRENAWRGAVESDLRNAAIQMETCLTRSTTSVYPASVDSATDTNFCDGVALTVSDGVTFTATGTGGTSYVITGSHVNVDEDLTYNSATGGLGDWT